MWAFAGPTRERSWFFAKCARRRRAAADATLYAGMRDDATSLAEDERFIIPESRIIKKEDGKIVHGCMFCNQEYATVRELQMHVQYWHQGEYAPEPICASGQPNFPVPPAPSDADPDNASVIDDVWDGLKGSMEDLKVGWDVAMEVAKEAATSATEAAADVPAKLRSASSAMAGESSTGSSGHASESPQTIRSNDDDGEWEFFKAFDRGYDYLVAVVEASESPATPVTASVASGTSASGDRPKGIRMGPATAAPAAPVCTPCEGVGQDVVWTQRCSCKLMQGQGLNKDDPIQEHYKKGGLWGSVAGAFGDKKTLYCHHITASGRFAVREARSQGKEFRTTEEVLEFLGKRCLGRFVYSASEGALVCGPLQEADHDNTCNVETCLFVRSGLTCPIPAWAIKPGG
eukprot:gnl/TRDRNA2_/TRDRNA2_195904_c0_seq1.p1 gnl/TRDRNA2_/TRDRNA2_195904_c0~~gnl/TRDRNA2_/TRDRNA2_195904_c0_seq1.p1  ORF type:complete len:417 (-),score=57.54 gnl/TRDRNA2_/TRDRNA2_195904_c0_seq1:52-1260(-)